MKKLAGIVSLVALLAVGADRAAEAEVTGERLATVVFEIHHKELDDVVSLIQSVLSDDASILLRSRVHTIAVTDHADNLTEAATLIADFDVPPLDVSLRINLILASRGERGRPAASMLGRLPPNFSELTKWMNYELLGGLSVRTTERERSSVLLGEEYRIRFQVDSVDDRTNRVRMRDFVLERRVFRPVEGETWVPIFDTVVNLKSGTPYVFGATRGQNARRALFLSITAIIEPS